MVDFTPNQTSAKLLLSFAQKRFSGDAGSDFGANAQLMEVLALDLYIKARSYAIINKTTFFIACLFSIAVIAWPSFSVLQDSFGTTFSFLKSSIVQTSVTAMAALSYAFYSHYKKRQLMAENILRMLVSAKPEEAEGLMPKVRNDIELMDGGFTFTDQTRK